MAKIALRQPGHTSPRGHAVAAPSRDAPVAPRCKAGSTTCTAMQCITLALRHRAGVMRQRSGRSNPTVGVSLRIGEEGSHGDAAAAGSAIADRISELVEDLKLWILTFFPLKPWHDGALRHHLIARGAPSRKQLLDLLESRRGRRLDPFSLIVETITTNARGLRSNLGCTARCGVKDLYIELRRPATAKRLRASREQRGSTEQVAAPGPVTQEVKERAPAWSRAGGGPRGRWHGRDACRALGPS